MLPECPDYESKCPSMAPLLQPQRRKYLFGGIGVFILITGIVLLVFFLTSGGDDSFVLDRTAFFAGRNNLPRNLDELLGNNLSKIHLDTDLSNDTIFGKSCPSCNTDILRLCKGKVSSQFWVARAGCDETRRISDALNEIDVTTRMIKKYSDYFQIIKQSTQLRDVFDEKKIGGLILLDGGQSISNSVAILRIFHELGVRALTLSTGNCMNNSNLTEYIEENGVLSEFGKNVVREMNTLGMMIDIQGLSTESQLTVFNTSKAPVMVSHTASAALFNHPDNLDDEMLYVLKANKGLIMVTFDAVNLGSDEENVTKSDVVRHINYIVDRIGFDNVAIGGNYDSENKKPLGLENVSDFPKVFEELKSVNGTKWCSENLDKLAGLNFQRFFQDVEKMKNTTKIIDEE